MKYLSSLIALFVLPMALFAAPKYPFPQAVKYSFGIKPAGISNDKVQSVYTDFMTKLYEESGDKARIKWDTETMTVSEGIGYGMMIMVYMDNTANNTQAKFDKLWKYYNSYLDAKGLMNWKITGFGSANQMNAATDAELDVAVGLLEAYKQWGDEKYLTDAKAFIAKIWKYEIDSAGGVLPGDSWGVWASRRNPSYFSTAAFQLFKKADSSNWSKVITNSYGLIMKARNATTGLVPDWCSNTGAADPSGGSFKYDAVRTPWRLAWAYSWYGHDTAKTVCSSIASWIATKTGGDPGKIGDGYNLDGTQTSQYSNGTFVGCFASAGLVDTKHQAWLDAAYKRLQDTLGGQKEVYYSQSLKLLNLILMSGNMPDFWTMPVSIASPHAASSSGMSSVRPAISWDSRASALTVSKAAGSFNLEIFNAAGKRIAGPYFGSSAAGGVKIAVGNRLQSGVYWARLHTAAGGSSTLLMVDR